MMFALRMVFVLALLLPVGSKAADRCAPNLRAHVAGVFVDALKLYGYDKALNFRLLTTDRSGRDYFDRILEIHGRGFLAQSSIERVLLRNWYTFSGEAIDDMILWFAKYGDRDS